jgi:coenzyme F420-reducing hydrogenase delta subunit
MSEQFEPVIVGFLCNWCSYRAADLAGTSRIKYAPNMCYVQRPGRSTICVESIA